MTTDPMSISAGIAATVLGATGILQHGLANVGHVSRIATETDLVTLFTEVSRPSADPLCSVVPPIPRY